MADKKSDIEKLIKFLNKGELSSLFDSAKLDKIAQNVIDGYQIDDKSRQTWLDINLKCVQMVKSAEEDEASVMASRAPTKLCKVVYQILTPAIIQLSSRMISHLTRNDEVGTCRVLGPDPQGLLAAKATRVSNYLNFDRLVDSNNWLLDHHKLCQIVAGWGTGFTKSYFDDTNNKVCDELLPPEDVIINHKVSCLDQARRITVRLHLTKNDIIEKMRSGQFRELDEDEFHKLDENDIDNIAINNDFQENDPVYEILEQYCYIDLDEDDYAEPYCVYVHKSTKLLLGIYPAYDIRDIHINPESGKIKRIDPRFNIVDWHLIDDPEGNFYSIGLNYILYHPCKATTAILRQLIDAGTLSNAAGTTGFMTKAFKTKEKSMSFELGKFKILETLPNTKLGDQITNLPIKEPSQVLLALLQLIIKGAQDNGFISDILTGDTETQNTPATTMLAAIEQSTRAFKPVIQKMYISRKKQDKNWFYLNGKYLKKEKYFKFQRQDVKIIGQDFDDSLMEITPVADPTQSSEAHKYAKINFLNQLMASNQVAGPHINVPAALMSMFTDLQYTNPQSLIAPPQPPPPDPMMAKVNADAQGKQKDQEIELLKQQLSALKLQIENRKVDVKEKETMIKGQVAMATAHEKYQRAQKERAQTALDVHQANQQGVKIALDHHINQQKVNIDKNDTAFQHLNTLQQQQQDQQNWQQEQQQSQQQAQQQQQSQQNQSDS